MYIDVHARNKHLVKMYISAFPSSLIEHWWTKVLLVDKINSTKLQGLNEKYKKQMYDKRHFSLIISERK
jgi:hypothetical protein